MKPRITRDPVRPLAISEATVANLKQNLGFSFVDNSLGVPLVAGVLYPFKGWLTASAR